MRWNHIYAVYDKDDMIVCAGTIQECASYLNMTVNSVYCALCRKSKSRKEYHIYRIEEDEEDD